MAVQKIKTAGGLVTLGGGVARQYLYGTGAPSSGLGNEKDVYARTDSPFNIYQKLSGTWTDVTWSQNVTFSTSSGSDYPAQFEFEMTNAADASSYMYFQTNYGTVQIGFYDSGMGQTPAGNNIDVDIYMYPDANSQIMQIVNMWNSGYSNGSISMGSNGGNLLQLVAPDGGSGSFISWNLNLPGGSISVASSGTNYGGYNPGEPTANTVEVRAAVAGKRHLLYWGYATYINDGETSSYYNLRMGNGGPIMASVSTAVNMYSNFERYAAPLGLFGIPGVGLYLDQASGNLPDNTYRAVLVNGYTLTD